MSQVNSVKFLSAKRAECLAQNRGQTPFIDINSAVVSSPGLGLHLQQSKCLILDITYTEITSLKISVYTHIDQHLINFHKNFGTSFVKISKWHKVY